MKTMMYLERIEQDLVEDIFVIVRNKTLRNHPKSDINPE